MKKPKTFDDLLIYSIPKDVFDLYRKVQYEGRTNMLAKHDVIALTGNKLSSAQYDGCIKFYKDLTRLHGEYKRNKRLTKVHTPILANDFIEGVKVLSGRVK